MDIRCYAQRMLNPFRGILNTVEFESAEAVTTDGIRWDIYVRNDDLLQDLDDRLVNQHRVQVSEIRYGHWTAAEGVTRGRLYDSDDFERMEMIGDMLLEQLHRVHTNIPFPLVDRYELWLLDWNRQPLVLLDSAIDEYEMDTQRTIDWRAGNLCRETFSASLFKDSDLTLPEGCLAQCLEESIRQLSGERPAAQWFKRLGDGSGIGYNGISLEANYRDRRLRPSAFPTFLIGGQANNHPAQDIFEAYIHWLTPWLLLLQDIDTGTRSRLEHNARQYAGEIARQFRLYPSILNPELIDVARVQALLGQEPAPKRRQQEDVLHAFYREIGVNG